MTLLAFLLPTLAVAAEPVLVPDFTPTTPQEYTLAVMLQGQVTDRLVADGYMVLTNDVVEPVVGAPAVKACAARPECPQQILTRLPTRVAVVVRVGRMGDTLVGRFEVWQQGLNQPTIERDVAIAPGQEHLFAQDISVATAHVVDQVGPSPDPTLMAAARLIAGQTSAPVAPAPAPVAPAPAPVAPAPAPVAPAPAPAPSTPAPAPAPQPAAPPALAKPAPSKTIPVPRSGSDKREVSPDAPLAEVLADTGVRPRHILGSEQNLRNSGMDPRDWVYKAMPHAGRVIFELRLGLGLGDVDRQGDMRVELVRNQVRDRWYQEGPLPARRPQGAIYFGYAPATMFDFGILAGFQYGQRRITTGYARVGDAGVDEISSPPRDVDAVQFNLQPRIRTYLVPVGPAKPYLVAGADFRIFNGYDLEQPPNFEYPLPPGGFTPGFAGGGGLMIDPSPIVGFFFEGTYTHHFGDRAIGTQSGIWSYRVPDLPVGLSYTIGLVGGVQIRI